MGGLFIDIYVEYIFRVFFHAVNLLRSRRWPIVKATVLSAECPLATHGCTVVIVYYEYVINGEKYGDWFGKPFVSHESGEYYAAQFVKGSGFTVRIKPGDVKTSIPLWAAPSAN